ncbi:Uncharacterised protein [Bordetella pertussis]|nr:Uncharacterised protein [Bordetella pertussis]
MERRVGMIHAMFAMVFERGSSTARMRAAPTCRRNPSMVVAMAVGWCAKSS